ncbi:hypothetical protein EC100869_3018 [Escherichia coli 10.0869]|nr:hypothetical protein EC100869_3018 [Escherichia coli 10.0869]
MHRRQRVYCTGQISAIKKPARGGFKLCGEVTTLNTIQ